MTYCQNCGTSLDLNQASCGGCGTAVHPAANAAPAAPGLQPNAAAALAYLAGIITGVVFLVVDGFKSDRFVRFHAFQSIFFNVAWFGLWIVWLIVGIVLTALTKGLFLFVELPLNLCLIVAGIGIWAFLMYGAYQGKVRKLPVVGALAAKQAGI